MEASTIVVIAGLASLLVERLFSYLRKIKRSKCCGCTEIEMNEISEPMSPVTPKKKK